MNVILYTTSCPKCILLKKLLVINKIKFSIESDLDTIMKIAYENNISTAPFLKIDNKILNFDEAMSFINENIKK